MGLRGGLIASLAAVWLLLPVTVHADARAEARLLYRRGMELIRQGQTEDGVEFLLRAHGILPHPHVLYNAARAYAEVGRYESSIALFERYLDGGPPDGEQVIGFIESMREILAARDRAAAASTTAQPPQGPSTPEGRPEETDALQDAAAVDRAAAWLEAVSRALGDDAGSDTEALLREMRALAARLRLRPGTDGQASATVAPATPSHPERSAMQPERTLELGSGHQGPVYEEQVVSASRFAEASITAPNATTIVTTQDIRLSGLTHPAELLRRVPGVEVMMLSPGDTQVSIRGLNQRASNKVLTLIDGRSVYHDYIGLTVWNSLPLALEDVERIEIIRGPASAVYGADAFSGIVNVILREPLEDRAVFSLGAGTGNHLRAVGTVTQRSGRMAYRLSAGVEREDQFSLDIDPRRMDYRVVESDEAVANERVWARADARLGLPDGMGLRLGSSLSLGDTSIYAVGRIRQMSVEGFLFSQSYAELETPIGLGARVFWNHHEANLIVLDAPVGRSTFGSFSRTNTLDLETSLSRREHLGVDHNFVVGAGYRLKTVHWTWLDADHRQHHFSVFGHDTMDIGEHLQAVVSLRLDRHPLLGAPQISPRGALIVLPTERSAIRATAGAAFRGPTALESYLETPVGVPVRGITTIALGDTELSPERMVSFELGYENQDSDHLAVELSGYFNLLDNAILLSRVNRFTLADYGSDRVRYLDSEESFPAATLAYENEDATFTQLGAEAGVRMFPMRGIDVHANYAIHDTSPLSQVELGGREHERRTSRHKVNLGAQYRSTFGLDLSADLHWVSEQIWLLQVTDLERGGIVFAPFRVAPYTVVNARVGYRFLEDRLGVGLVGTNLVAPGHREHPYGQPRETRLLLTVQGTI